MQFILVGYYQGNFVQFNADFRSDEECEHAIAQFDVVVDLLRNEMNLKQQELYYRLTLDTLSYQIYNKYKFRKYDVFDLEKLWGDEYSNNVWYWFFSLVGLARIKAITHEEGYNGFEIIECRI